MAVIYVSQAPNPAIKDDAISEREVVKEDKEFILKSWRWIGETARWMVLGRFSRPWASLIAAFNGAWFQPKQRGPEIGTSYGMYRLSLTGPISGLPQSRDLIASVSGNILLSKH